VVLSLQGWTICAGNTLHWQISALTSGMSAILPSMKTDIELYSKVKDIHIVIDTKFNSILVPGRYRDETLRSGYIYQIYTYIRSQERDNDPKSLNTSGLLLHPSLGREIDEVVIIQGHSIRFATVDLSVSSNLIRSRLIDIINEYLL
jgi:5-methylcytosine-specific restriction enzyme subunit McrC